MPDFSHPHGAYCRADLHCHSTASDGRLSPRALLEQAAEAKVELLALTDHDTTAGLAEAALNARRLGIDFITGIELSVSWAGKTLHVVGLDIEPDNAPLQKILARLQALRLQRAQTIASKLHGLGLKNAFERARQAAGGGQITRTHFARLLVEDALVSDLKQAFKRHLGAGKPACVRIDWISLEEAIQAIHGAGGLAVLAHPLSYKFSGAWRQRMLQAFKQAGGDGLEVSCGANQQAHDLALLTEQALQHDLLASMGSDFHAPEQIWLGLGRLAPLSHRLTPVWQRFGAKASPA